MSFQQISDPKILLPLALFIQEYVVWSYRSTTAVQRTQGSNPQGSNSTPVGMFLTDTLLYRRRFPLDRALNQVTRNDAFKVCCCLCGKIRFGAAQVPRCNALCFRSVGHDSILLAPYRHLSDLVLPFVTTPAVLLL